MAAWIPRIDRIGFESWRMIVYNELVKEGLDHHIDDFASTKTPQPTTGVDADGHVQENGFSEVDVLAQVANSETSESFDAEFRVRDAHAKCIIYSTLDKPHMLLVLPCKTARQVWARLELGYSRIKKHLGARLTIEYYSFKMNPRKSMSQNIMDLEIIEQRLKALGVNVDPELRVPRLFDSLHDEYKEYRDVWKVSESTFDQSVAALLRIENRRP